MAITRRFIALAVAAAAACAVPSLVGRVRTDAMPLPAALDAAAEMDLRSYLQARATPPAEMAADERGPEVWSAVLRFYEARGHAPVWIRSGQATPEARAALEALRRAEAEGLDPATYASFTDAPRLLTASAETSDHDGSAAREVALTHAFLRYAADLLEGRFDPRGSSGVWALQPAPADLARFLQEALQQGSFARTVESLIPQDSQYAALREALARHRSIAAAGGWPALAADWRLRTLGTRHPQVAVLRARLLASGDLSADEAVGQQAELFDRPLQRAIARFQSRHGLAADGVLGKSTLRELNVPVEQRIRQIELNLERWRWLPRDRGHRHILVNVPAFELYAFTEGTATLRMTVVTGKAAQSPTPIFGETMTTVVFSPYWNVPPGIAAGEVLPSVRRDPGYLARNDMEALYQDQVLDASSVDWASLGPQVQFRQRPGAGNSLGLVKFLFPNRYNVYLHDTPAHALFQRQRRDLSHGCVRLENPFELARWVLQGTEWTRESIHSAMHGGEERHVRLPEPISVLVVYQTVWVDQGVVRFLPDIYGHDAAQLRRLPAPAGAPVVKA